MKFRREEPPFLEPFAVCGILFGLAVIGFRILAAVSAIQRETLLWLFKGSVIVSASAGLIYAVFSMRERLKGSFADRALYGVVIAIFASVVVGAALLMEP